MRTEQVKLTLTQLIKLLQEAEANGFGEYLVGAEMGDYGWDWLNSYKTDHRDKTFELF